MFTETVHPDTTALLRLRVQAEADPSALTRVLERIQHLNVVPRRVTAEFGTNDVLHIQVDIVGLPERRLTLLAEKIGQFPCVLRAYWHRT